MLFSNIIGQDKIKEHLWQSVAHGRIPHAQLFVGPEGSGALPMAIAYAQYLTCQNTGEENSNGNTSCNVQFEKLSHPDLHFLYPTVTNKEISSKPKSIDFLPLWREFVLKNPYASLMDWYDTLQVGNKQGIIRVDDAIEVQRIFSLKSFEGSYKVLIIWMAEKMNLECSNKLLKMIEEPPVNTLILLVAEKTDEILPTILSRCQVLRFPKLTAEDIQFNLMKTQYLDAESARKLAVRCQGNYQKALQLLDVDFQEHTFENLFIHWVRMAFAAKKNPTKVIELIQWSEEVATYGREKQKAFLDFCLEFFRQALLLNYQAGNLVYYEPFQEQFKLENFAPFVNGSNITEIYEVIEAAQYGIERNGNPKLIFSDMSIKLTRLIHKK